MANTGNGNKQIVLNTRERVLSTDANRAQTFYGQGVSEILRFLLDADCEEDRFGGAYEVMGDGTESPVRYAILNGIRPQPVNGTTSLFITPGVMAIVDNPADPNTDDSVASWIVDPGISTAGVLTLPANVSGQTIIAVVECQRSTVVLEQDNRDVFNVSTGLFSPVLVNKVVAGRLVYRVRLGTPGAGFPGVVAGWIPLAVVNQPSGATTWDDVLLMWDVRALINDRWNAPFENPREIREWHKGFGTTDLQTVGQSRLYSQIETTYGEARAGGRLGLNSPSAAAVGFFDLKLAANQTGNFAGFVANRWWHVYAMFPFGLPRWQLYSPSTTPSPRRPVGPRGIPAITNVGPNYAGTPVSNLTTPTATGLVDTASQNAVILVSGKTDATPDPLPVNLDGKVIWTCNDATPNLIPSATSHPSYDEYTFTDNTTHPGNARAVYVRFIGTFALSAADVIYVNPVVVVGLPDGTVGTLSQCHYGSGGSSDVTVNPPLQFGLDFVARIPLAPAASGFSAARTFKVRWMFDYTTLAAVVTAGSVARVIGWEFGP